MLINANYTIALLVSILPMGLLLWCMDWQINIRRKAAAVPFKELPRRPAGEALRLKLESMHQDFSLYIIMLLVIPPFAGMAWLGQPSHGLVSTLIYLALVAGPTAFFGWKILKLFPRKADYQLGYEGERFVGEELNRLITLGFEIYHDVPFDGFNIDHVLIGPRGVFVVETKTRRKPRNCDGDKQYRVQFDGKRLLWPRSHDSHGIEQSRNNAKKLADWLGSASGENVWVIPILTLPGWMVERLAPPDGLHVVNPKEIRQVCAGYPEKLSEPQLRRLRHHMDQKCRLTLD